MSTANSALSRTLTVVSWVGEPNVFVSHILLVSIKLILGRSDDDVMQGTALEMTNMIACMKWKFLDFDRGVIICCGDRIEYGKDYLNIKDIHGV